VRLLYRTPHLKYVSVFVQTTTECEPPLRDFLSKALNCNGTFVTTDIALAISLWRHIFPRMYVPLKSAKNKKAFVVYSTLWSFLYSVSLPT